MWHHLVREGVGVTASVAMVVAKTVVMAAMAMAAFQTVVMAVAAVGGT